MMIRNFILAALSGAVLLFPRILLVHDLAPPAVLGMHREMEAFFSPYKQSRPLAGKKGKRQEKAAKQMPVLQHGIPPLEGIIYEARTESKALFGDEILTAGDEIGGWKITRIDRTFVVLRKGSETMMVYLDGRRRTVKPELTEQDQAPA